MQGYKANSKRLAGYPRIRVEEKAGVGSARHFQLQVEAESSSSDSV